MRFDIDRLKDDIDARGWSPRDLFRIAGVTMSRGYYFLRGLHQSAKTAEALTRALGKPEGHYLIRRTARRAPKRSKAVA